MAQPELVKDIEARVKKSGDTMTGNLIGKYFQGTWLQTTSITDLGSSPSKIAVIKDDGWIYYRTPSELANDIGLTGNYVLKSGDTMTGNLTAPTFIGSLQGNASSSTYSTYTYYRDTRNANEMPLDMLKGVSLHLKSNSADGLSDGLSYHPVLMLRDWNDLSGGPFAELTITGNQNLYFRSSTTNADNTWNPWRKVLTDYNYTSILNNTYLPLTGGTLSGSVKIAGGTFNYSTIQNGTSNSDRNVWFSASGSRGIPCYNDNFKYNPSTNTLTVGNVKGTISSSYYLKGRTYWESWANNGNYSGIQYLQGQLPSSTTPTANKVYLGSSGEYSVISAPSNTYQNGGTNNPCNVMLLRLYWGTTYFREFSSSPNNDTIMTRNVKNGSADPWRRLWQEGDAVTGAVWNDYAECREADTIEPGYVLVETGDDTLTKSTERLSPFAGVSSDTWGFSQGETDKAKTPIAVAGRVLVYPWQDRNNYKPGDCVCAAPEGKVDIMTREEIIQYPDRIVGTVSSVPTYDKWGGGENADREPVDVDGRIWIKVR